MARQRKPKRDVHQEVTDRIIEEALSKGIAPWIKPWNAQGGFPVNASTNKPYNGVNVFLLYMTEAAMGYAASRWLTYKQAQKAKGQVRKGEKGTQIVFFKWSEFKDKADPTKTKRIPFLRYYTVFNVAQCDGLTEKAMGEVDESETLSDEDRIAHAEEFFGAIHKSTGITPSRGGAKAAYSPMLDRIVLPKFETFQDAASAYSTEAHEFGHATGHTSRLDRDLTGRFGGESYAAEELVAEMTSAFVCAQLGLTGKLQHPEYIANWIKILRGDKRAIFTAASLAKKAHAFLAEAAGEPLELPKAAEAEKATA